MRRLGKRVWSKRRMERKPEVERERKTRESDRQKERDGQRKGREWEMNERQETDLLAGYQERWKFER